ncbi:MAG: hypothetical protein HW389_3403 [Bacteroidetes bacterium]|nr:hypothetical protein [Bacteroidota bacterium]
MGQQQFLLTVLGVVIIGISIRIGFRIVDAQYMQQSRDQLISHMQTVYGYAEAFATKTKKQGGGAGTYTGFRLPKNMSQLTSGTFTATVSGTTNLTIVGTGKIKGNNGKSPVSVTYKITKRKLTKPTINN